MKILLSISELLQLQSTLRGEASKAQSVVTNGAYKEMNGDLETKSVTVEDFEASLDKLNEINALSIHVADSLHEANRGTPITHKTDSGQVIQLNLASALDYVKQIRIKSSLFERLGNAQKVTVQNVYGSSERIVVERHYDIEKFAEEARELSKEANRLSREIERQSVLAIVEVEGVSAYL